MTLSVGLSLMLASVAGEVRTENGWRYDRYVASTDCDNRRPLSEKEKTGLTFGGDVFRILTIVGREENADEKAEWMILGVDSKPMNQAGEFPEGRCASEAMLSTANGKSYKGIAEFRDSSADREHRDYSMRVLFEDKSPISELRYNSRGYRIDGHIGYKNSGNNTRPFAGWSVVVEQWN